VILKGFKRFTKVF